MLVDNIYINEDQITHIKYSVDFRSEEELAVYKCSKFKIVAINEEYLLIYLLKNNIWKEDRVIYSFHKDYNIEKNRLSNSKKLDKTLIDKEGKISATIELSSGYMHKTTIQKFKHTISIDEETLYGIYKEEKLGMEFNPDNIDINYIYSKLFNYSHKGPKTNKIEI